MQTHASKEPLSPTQAPQPTALSSSWQLLVAACFCTCLATAAGFWLGTTGNNLEGIPPALAASASSSETMAIATGPISDDAEGIFFLDFVTGDLQCWVYYPRQGTFGAKFGANIGAQFGPPGKNSKMMMVTGAAKPGVGAGGSRPGASLVYVADGTKGIFAAYAVPWNKGAESGGRPQAGQLVYAGGGPIRNFNVPNGGNQNPAAPANPANNP
ncbi:MAG: hypothetical protein AAF483_20015 [Planctomycetota bacterium]